MGILEAIVLGIVQGLTEFAPVSSSAHLVLVPWALSWEEQPSLAFDTILHLGTLVAVVAVFWRDIFDLAAAWLRSFTRSGRSNPKAAMAWAILAGTVPAAVMGYLFKTYFEELFSKPLLVGAFLLVTALALVGGELLGRRVQSRPRLGVAGGLLVGIAQVFAIAPGISRSGATMAAGRLLGLSREDAARFSFLLSIPIILGAGVSQIREMIHIGEVDIASIPIILGAGVSQIREMIHVGEVDIAALPVLAGFLAAAVSGYLCINFLLSFLRRRSFFAFSAYCVVIGVGAIALSLMRGA